MVTGEGWGIEGEGRVYVPVIKCRKMSRGGVLQGGVHMSKLVKWRDAVIGEQRCGKYITKRQCWELGDGLRRKLCVRVSHNRP